MFARKAFEAQPDFSLAYKVAGEVLLSLNRREEAERMLMYGIILGEEDEDSISNLGGIAAQRGNGKLAYILFNRVLAKSPEHQISTKNLELLKQEVSSQRYKLEPVVCSNYNKLIIMEKQKISYLQRKLNEELHQSRPDFGSRGGAGHQGVIQVIGRYKDLGMISSVLDYGTGKGAFPKLLKNLSKPKSWGL